MKPATHRITVNRGFLAAPVSVEASADQDCSTCHGRGEMTVLRHGARVTIACACVKGRAAKFVRAQERKSADAVAPEISTPGPSARHEQIMRIERTIAEIEGRRHLAVADKAATLAEAQKNAHAAAATLEARQQEIVALSAEALRLATAAADLQRQAAALDRQSSEKMAAASAIERADIPWLVAAAKDAEVRAAAVEQEQRRIERHFDRKIEPLRARVARIRRRLGSI